MKTDAFINLLRDEFERRKKLNSRYSLRSYARNLGIYHGTLSRILSGKRKLTASSLNRLAQKLDPENSHGFFSGYIPQGNITDYVVLSPEVFNEISEWYYDAIIELIKIRRFPWSSAKAAKYLDLPVETVEKAVQKLLQLGLLEQGPEGIRVKCSYTSNLENNEQTSEMMRKYQRSILELSLKALDTVDRKWRDHQSTMLAVNKKDVSRVKEIIRKFSMEISSYLQTERQDYDEVYELAISFFPLNRKDFNTDTVEER